MSATLAEPDTKPTPRFLLSDCLAWGVALWLIGYVLGIAFFPVVPVGQIGWYVMPLGLLITCIVLWRWVRVERWDRAAAVGLTWSAIAIVFDYLFIVLLLAPADGYYKIDVYLYYASAFLLPLAAAALRQRFGERSPDGTQPVAEPGRRRH